MGNLAQDDAIGDCWLTVVMPVHEGATYLDATLASLIGEVDTGVEIIILDSSVDDRCAKIVDGYRNRLRIDYIHQPDIKSWTQKTNIAVTCASATHVAMLHQDDLWLPGRGAAIKASLIRHPQASMHLFPSRFIDAVGRDLGPWRCPLDGQMLWSGRVLIERLLVQNFIAIPAPVIRKADWVAVGGLDEPLWYTADWNLYLKLAACGEITYEATATTAFRVHGKSLTMMGSRDLEMFQQQIETVINRHVPSVVGSRARRIRRLAEVSMSVNVGLAAAAVGRWGPALGAIGQIVRLSPIMLLRYLHWSRLWERLNPRLRARLSGKM